MVIVVASAVILLCHQSVDPAPVSIKYVGNGSFPNAASLNNYPYGASVRSGPTFSITNHTSKALLASGIVEVRLGTKWTYDPSFPNIQSAPLAANSGVYFTIDFNFVRSGRTSPPWVGSDSTDYPTNTWRLHVVTQEALSGPASVLAALKLYSRSLFDKRIPRVPMKSLFEANRTWYGTHQFVSEEVLDPKSRQ